MRQLLRQTITILRSAYGQGANMGITSPTSPVYTNLAASIQPASSALVYYYAQRGQRITYTIFVAGTLDLRRGDTITDGRQTYQVIGWRDQAGREYITAIDCEVLDP